MASGPDLGAIASVFAIFFIFGGPVIAWVVIRYMAHRERMEMIRHGFDPAHANRRAWRSGTTFVPPPGQSASTPPVYDEAHDCAQRTLRKGITLTFVGFALTLGLGMIGFHEVGGEMQYRPGPWLLGGFIPMFVGLAQVTIALLSGATFPRTAMRAGPTFSPPPPPQTPPGPVQATAAYDSSYTYRPDPNVAELQQPVPPPAPGDRWKL